MQLPSYATSASAEEIAKTYGVEKITFLASNENPYGSSPQVQQVFKGLADLGHRYPDSSGRGLKNAIASHHVIEPDQVFLGNGSNEILEAVARVYLDAGDEIIVSEHSFAMYPIFAKSAGADVKFVPMKNWHVDVNALASAVSQRTKVIYLANANNPTGTMLPLHDIVEFLSSLPSRIVVVIDEAYIEFADENFTSAIELTSTFPNLLISRTFSKAYGLAGFRVGYGISNNYLVSHLEKIQQPFNVNSVAQRAAQVAIADQVFLQNVVSKNKAFRDLIKTELIALGCEVLPSQANFVTFCLPNEAKQCYEFLLSRGLIIRPLDGYQMKDWLRVSVGTAEENEQFISLMREFREANHDQ